MTAKIIEFKKPQPEEVEMTIEELIDTLNYYQEYISGLATHLTVVEAMRIKYGFESEEFKSQYLSLMEYCRGK